VGALTHEAFFYSSDEEFAARLAPFLRDAVVTNQGAIAITTETRLELLRERLGIDADAVSFVDATQWYRSPGATLLAWRDALDQQLRDGNGFVRAIGEVQFGDDEVGLRHWTRYESLINRAFSGRPAWLVCPYNTLALPKEILADARRTHPIVSTPSGRAPSPAHFATQELGAVMAPAEDRPEAQERTCVTMGYPPDLPELRRSVRWEAQSAGLSVDVVDDLLLAVGEVVRGTLAGEGATATVRTARQGGEWFCEIRADSSGSDALPLGADQFGLVIARVIGDGVEVADDEKGSLVRFVFGKRRAEPRQRILTAASQFFRENGVRATGINALIARADVAKATFYAQFQSKEDLIRLWLRSPAVGWFDHVRAEVEARTRIPAERLTTFFDVLGEWLVEDDFRGCSFINTAAEFRNAHHASRQELADLSDRIEEYFRRNAVEAGFVDPDGVAAQLFLLVPGTITTATARISVEPARVARAAAAGLVASASRST
jgi:AcrR family transcriptional regulator